MSENSGAIVVGVDGSDGALTAARWAAAVAAEYKRPLHIVHAGPGLGHNMTDAVATMRAALMTYQRERAEEFLRTAEETVRAQNPELDVTTLSTDIPVDEVLIDAGRTAHMIVVGNSQVSPAGALFLGSTTLAVATHAPCPIVAWRGTNITPSDQPVVVGVDETQSSGVVLDAAFEFADRFGVKLAAVRSWSVRGSLAAKATPFVVDWDGLEAIQWTQLTNQVDKHNQRHPHVDATCYIETAGPTAALLHQIAIDGAQMVVVGSHARRPLTRALLGSTALNLLHHSNVPVMICR